MGRSIWWVGTTGIAAAALASLTAAVPDWIEAVLGISPDRGSGWLEWSCVTLLAALAFLCAAIVGSTVGLQKPATRHQP